MDNVVNVWFPILAVIISVISLVISYSNSRFMKKFEAAKKRTEIMSNVSTTLVFLRKERDHLFLVKDICNGCPSSRAESICSRYNSLIERLDGLYQELDEMTDVGDPIRLEYAIAKHKKVQQDAKEFGSIHNKKAAVE